MPATASATETSGEVPNRTYPRIGPRVGIRNPFPSPPATTYVAPAPYGDSRTRTRTPAQVREVHHRQVSRWFGEALWPLPKDTSREDMIASVFGIRGWTVRARIVAPEERWPMHGWFLTHPTNGLVIYADKPRDGDKGLDYVAPTGGAFAQARLTWGSDLADLIDQTIPALLGNDIYPHLRATKALTAYAYLNATPPERDAAAMLLALSGRNVAEFIAHCAATDVPVTPA